MADRRGVIVLMYDIPVNDRKERKEYTRFMKAIRQMGFIRLQNSVYMKLVHNSSYAAGTVRELNRVAPEDSSVVILPMSLGEARKMFAIRGPEFDFDLFADDFIAV